MCPAECAAGPADWSLVVPCPVPDGEVVVPAFPGSLELGQHRQEPGFIKDLLERQTNSGTDAVTIRSASSSSSCRTSPFSSLPEAGREKQLKMPVYVSMAVLDPGSQGTLTPAAGLAREMGQEKMFF